MISSYYTIISSENQIASEKLSSY